MRIKIEDIDGLSTRYLYEGSGAGALAHPRRGRLG